MNRRHFFKAGIRWGSFAGMAPTANHAAAQNRPPIPGSLGMLDSTLWLSSMCHKMSGINHPEPMGVVILTLMVIRLVKQ